MNAILQPTPAELEAVQEIAIQLGFQKFSPGVAERLARIITAHPRLLAVDHNHSTGVVRELLCSKCNMILGFVEKNTSTVFSALEYIKRHSTYPR